MNISLAVRKRIEELAEQRKISLSKLGEIAGLNNTTAYRLGLGRDKAKLPELITIYKICLALDVTMAEFFNSEYFYDVQFCRSDHPEAKYQY